MDRFLPLFLLLAVAACTNTGQETHIYPVLGKDRVDAVPSESPAETLGRWGERGMRGATVVRAGGTSGFGPVTDEAFAAVSALVKEKRWTELAKGPYLRSGTLAPAPGHVGIAARAGMVSRVIWLVPSRLLAYSDSERRVKALLVSEGAFDLREIGDLRLSGGCVGGRLSGIDLEICDPETFPQVPGPVLLDIDAAFFPAYSEARRISPLRGIGKFYDEVRRRQLRVAAVNINGYATRDTPDPALRFTEREIIEIVRDPAITASASPPEPWSLRDAIEPLFSIGNYDAVLEAAKKGLRRFPDDPSFALYQALAGARRGREGEALDALAGLCRSDERLCAGLIHAARGLERSGRPDRAGTFLRKAVELRPAWTEGLIALAGFLARRGDHEGALRLYLDALRRAADPDLMLAAGDAYRALGRVEDAYALYARALPFYLRKPMPPLSEPAKESFKQMLGIAESRGERDSAARIRRTMGLP